MRIQNLSTALLTLSLGTVNAFSPIAITRQSTSSFALNMAETALTQDELKKMVGYKAVDDYVKSGMVVGLGTGSTAYYAVERVGNLLKSGELKDIVCIPTSERTKEQALSLDIPLVTLDTHSKLDVAIDGADEVDPSLNLVKGGGGALLREKMVEVMADKFIVIGTYNNKKLGLQYDTHIICTHAHTYIFIYFLFLKFSLFIFLLICYSKYYKSSHSR